MSRLYQVIGLLVISVSSFAQSNRIIWTPSTELSFRNFSEVTTRNYLDIQLNFNYEINPITFQRFRPIVTSEVVFDPRHSTLESEDPRNLKYAQIIFDMQGYASRVLKYKVMQLGDIKDSPQHAQRILDDLYAQVRQNTNQMQNAFEQELTADPSAATLQRWANKVAELIKQTPEVEVVETFTQWSIGLYTGIGRNLFLGKTKSYFTDATSFNLGFSFDHAKSRISFDMNLGGNKTRDYFYRKGDWLPATKTNLAAIELTYGRKIQRNHWVYIPFVGAAVNEFTPRKNKDDDRILIGYGPTAGIEICRIFKTKSDYQERAFFFYKARLSVNPTNFVSGLSGSHINLRIAVGFDASKTRRGMAIVKKNDTI
ncbi:hypothetical protein QE357_002546 [Siphonobacter sp. BAB-5404]|nr:hypothetical protein [Siphonobacter sp. SORGH_AS_0500]